MCGIVLDVGEDVIVCGFVVVLLVVVDEVEFGVGGLVGVWGFELGEYYVLFE